MATKFDLKSVQSLAERQFYAGVGVTDLAVSAVREYVADVQKSVTSIDLQPQALRQQAVTRVNARVDAIEDTYGDLVKRGESLVGRISRQKSTQDTVKAAETTVAKARTTRTQATKATKTTAQKATGAAKRTSTAARKQSAPARSSAKATRTSARKTATSAAKAVSDAAAKVGS